MAGHRQRRRFLGRQQPLRASLLLPLLATCCLPQFIDWSNLECLNEQPQHAAANGALRTAMHTRLGGRVA
jgi:hypothetical protein